MAFALTDLIFPPRCAHCRQYLHHGQALCVSCRRMAVIHRTFFCGKCRARRYAARGICHRKFPFTLASAGEYDDPIIQSLIRALKFHFIRNSAEPLGDMLATYFYRTGITRSFPYAIILPLPLSSRRRRERGFNQSELIASALGLKISVSVNSSTLIRTRHSPPQSGLRSDMERHNNVVASFAVQKQKNGNCNIAGRNIILLDDVITSGATMLSAALTARAAGAKNILALTAAKA